MTTAFPFPLESCFFISLANHQPTISPSQTHTHTRTGKPRVCLDEGRDRIGYVYPNHGLSTLREFSLKKLKLPESTTQWRGTALRGLQGTISGPAITVKHKHSEVHPCVFTVCSGLSLLLKRHQWPALSCDLINHCCAIKHKRVLCCIDDCFHRGVM
jgi:hypothetical protein